MAKYMCLRAVDFDGGTKNSGMKFVPGMIHIGDEPKCGKGTSLCKPETYGTKRGKVEVGPAFELVKEPKKVEPKKKKATKGKVGK